MRRASAVLAGLLMLGGCNAAVVVGDAGRDSGVDSGALDGGAGDAGRPDAGDLGDGGEVELDAGPFDGGPLVPDAGPPDAGPYDAGNFDAGNFDAAAVPCDPIAQTGCASGQTCRTYRWVSGTGWVSAAPFCDASRSTREHSACQAWMTGLDPCEAETFCHPNGATCTRYCDPAGTPCPDFWSFFYGRAFPQECRVPTSGPAYCDCVGGACPPS